MDSSTCALLFSRFRARLPHPASELSFSSPFELLVAVILSAQSTDKRVNQVTPDLFAAANTPQSMLTLGEDNLRHLIRSIGLYQAKATYILGASQMLVERYQGTVPDNREDLELLPGVGRKTANVVLNVAFQQPTIGVDTHVYRLAKRLGLASGKTPSVVEKQLQAIIPIDFQYHANHWLVLHGRYICTARAPRCSDCFVTDLCAYFVSKNL